MRRQRRLHVYLSDEEMEMLRDIAGRLGSTVSDAVRVVIRSADAAGGPGARVLVLDRETLAAYVRNVRSLGQLLNQSTRALNGIAKAARMEGVDAADFAEALRSVSRQLEDVRLEAADVRRRAGEVTGVPVVFGG